MEQQSTNIKTALQEEAFILIVKVVSYNGILIAKDKTGEIDCQFLNPTLVLSKENVVLLTSWNFIAGEHDYDKANASKPLSYLEISSFSPLTASYIPPKQDVLLNIYKPKSVEELSEMQQRLQRNNGLQKTVENNNCPTEGPKLKKRKKEHKENLKKNIHTYGYVTGMVLFAS